MTFMFEERRQTDTCNNMIGDKRCGGILFLEVDETNPKKLNLVCTNCNIPIKEAKRKHPQNDWAVYKETWK